MNIIDAGIKVSLVASVIAIVASAWVTDDVRNDLARPAKPFLAILPCWTFAEGAARGGAVHSIPLNATVCGGGTHLQVGAVLFLLTINQKACTTPTGQTAVAVGRVDTPALRFPA